MTRARKDKPAAEPLATKVRAALAQGWHTLDALESLAGRATGARLRVHAALGELRAAGCALEERVERGVAEVRLGAATGPDHPTLREPSPLVEGEPVDAASYYLGRGRGEEDAPPAPAPRYTLSPETIAEMGGPAEAAATLADEEGEVVDLDAFERGARGATLDAPAPPCKPAAPVALTLPAPRPDDGAGDLDADDQEAALDETEGEDARAHCSPRGKPKAETIARVAAALDAAPPQPPGPSSRCARCGEQYRHHASNDAPNAHPFQAKPRGRPRVAPAATSPALDAPQPTADARAVYEAIKAAGNVRVVAADRSPGNASGAVLYAAAPDAAEEARRMVPPPRCPSVWHDVQCDREAGHPCGSADEPGRHHSAHEGRSGWTDEAATGWARRRAEEARETARGGSRGKRAPAAPPVVAPRCRPPACHADDIHVPSAVRGFARPLCERHRRWVEEAGGTVARADALDVIH